MHRICFVCLGNICRSPTAEGVMLAIIEREGLEDQFQIDSAGTSGWHVGERPDPRTIQTAKARGVSLPSRSRKFAIEDFDRFDLIVAMDKKNKAELLALASSQSDEDKVCLLRDFDPSAEKNAEVPDPYYGGARGFDDVFDICERGCEGLLKSLC